MSKLNGQPELYSQLLAAVNAAFKAQRYFASAVVAAWSACAEAASARAAFHQSEAALAEMHALVFRQQSQDAYVERAAEDAQEPAAEPPVDDENKNDDSDDSADEAPSNLDVPRRNVRPRLTI